MCDTVVVIVGNVTLSSVLTITLWKNPLSVKAVSISGFSEKFFFYGFFPEKKKVLEDDLKNLSLLESSIVFFVSPKKINRFIPLLKIYFSGRKILICREMTKYYEEFIRSKIDELEKFEFEVKGELTIVISERKTVKKNSQTLSESDKKIINQMINKLSIKEIVSLIEIIKKDLEILGITKEMKLRKVYDDMIPYLFRHRKVFGGIK